MGAVGLEEKKTGKVHGLTLKERKYGKLTGVQDIHSFNENEILLQTEAGKVQIKGEQLHVKSLDLFRVVGHKYRTLKDLLS